MEELDLKLVKVIDTHIHADHVSAMAALRDATRCVTVMGEQSPIDVVSMRVRDSEEVTIEGLKLKALHTPGHTSESYSFLMDDRVFTGDTLLIRGTGRTDFQNGDPYDQYHSLFERLLKLPDATYVYPAHDYHGRTWSTIGEERKWKGKHPGWAYFTAVPFGMTYTEIGAWMLAFPVIVCRMVHLCVAGSDFIE